MAKQLNISLAFTADTSKAKAELQDLQRQLTQLTNAPISNSGKGFFLTKEIQDATAAAADLRIKLQQATDVNTGKLDLNKFDQALKQSGTSLKSYREALSNLGSAGDKAFASLASSIMKADVPLRTTNKLLAEFKTTLMNTVRWQISSSILHGFIGTLQSAYGYAQDLNQSLNNIRIVTGFSSDEMAKFANEANKAAQALSTTTTKYTDASLIYYQQGIRDQEEIAARTETTIKLANVSRQITEDVSSQMTAIWNNFDDGTHNLEYYADVITALGAATASSSQEIAKGMQQFAAVADTVGLSYEYAAASLATIVSVTRQSESTVGNGLRTIFSRLEGLKLGDTLEDGTDLNKYSQALAVIGVNIKDASGQLKDMDSILEETAEKWDQLDKAQKVAFATTVGGVRQYTNLIALLDNWDMVQENIGIAKNSEGTLQEQQDIYAEGWEAAEKRVRVAAEKIYQDLINDKFFITLLDGFKTVLNIIDNTIQAMGGLKGVLIALGPIITNLFQKEIASEINRIGQNIRIITGQAAKATADRKIEAASEMQQMTANAVDENTGNAMATVYAQQGQLQQELINNASRLTEERQKELQNLLDINTAIGQNVIKTSEEADAAERKLAADQKSLALKMSRNASNDPYKEFEVNAYIEDMRSLGKMTAEASGLGAAFKEAKIESNQIDISLQNVNSTMERLATEAAGFQFEDAEGDVQVINNKIQEVQNIISNLTSASGDILEGTKQDANDLYRRFAEIEALLNRVSTIRYNDANQIGGTTQEISNLQNLGLQAEQTGAQIEHSKQQLDQFKAGVKELNNEINKTSPSITDFGKKATAASATITTTVMVVNNLVNAIKTLANPDLSGFEKFTGVLGSLAMTIPMVISTLVQLSTTFGSVGAAATAAWTAITGPIGLAVIGTLALITAGVAALTYTWKKQEEQKPENQLKKINEELEKTRNLLKDATTEASNLSSSFNNYDSIVEKLKNADKATAEWKNSLIDAQTEAQKLINTYSLVKDEDYFYNESGGFVEFTKSGKDKATNVANSRQTSAQIYTNAAAIKSYQKQLEINSGKIEKNNETDSVQKLVDKYNNALDYSSTGIYSGKTSEYHMDYDQMVSMIENIDNLQNVKNGLSEGSKNIGESGLASQWSLSALEQIESDLIVIANNWDIISSKVNNDNISLEKKNNLLQEQIELTQKQSVLTANRNTEDYNADAEFLYSKQLKGTSEYQARQQVEGLTEQERAEQYYKNVYGDKAKVEDGKVSILQEDDTWGEAKAYDINSITEQLIAEAIAQPSNQEAVNKAFDRALNSINDDNINEDTKNNLANVIADATMSGSNKLDLSGLNSEDILGLNLDELNIKEEFRNQLKVYQDVSEKLPPIKSIEELAENYNNIISAGSKITEDNSIIDDKSYQTLAQAGIAVDAYFQQMADGTHQLIVDASEFKRVIEDIAMKDMYDAAKASTNQTIALNNFNDNKGNLDLLSEDDKNSILSLAGVSNTDIADIAAIEDSAARSAAYMDKFQELDLVPNSEKINDLFEKSAENATKIQQAINNTNFKNDVERYGLDLEETTQYAKELEEQFKDTGKSEVEITKASRDLAISNQRLDKGLNDLNDNLKNYEKALKKSNKGTAEYSKTMGAFKDSLSDMLNIADGDMLSDTFAESFLEGGENAEKFKAALDGDADAILELRMAAADDIMLNLTVTNNLDVAQEEITEKWQNIKDIIESDKFKAPGFDQTDLIASFNDLIKKGEMTKEQIEAALAGLHVSANVKTNYVEQTVQVPTYDEYSTASVEEPARYETGPDGQQILVAPPSWKRTTWTVPGPTIPATGYVPQYELEGTEGEGGITSGITPLPPPAASKGSTTSGKKSGGGGGGGGGGSTPKPAKKKDVTKKNDEKEIDRYIKINQELAQKEHESNLLKTKLDSTSGQTAIKVMKEQLDILKQQKGLYGELAKEAENYRVKDLEKLKQDFADLNFQIDPSDGMLMNYEALLKEQTDLYNKVYNEWTEKIIAAEKEYNAQIEILGEAATEEALKPWAEAIEKIKEESKDLLREAEERYELFKKDTDKYNNSVEQARKAAEEAAAKELEAYNQELEIIAKGVELKIKVDDADLQYLEFLLKQIGDTVDGTLDRMANYAESIESNMNKIEKYQDGLEDVLDHAGIDFDDLLDGDLDDLGTFNEEDLAKVEEYRDGLISCGEQLIDLRKKILNEVHEAFGKFNSDLDDAVGRIEHLKKFTETYKNIIDIIGKKVIDPTGQTTLMLTKTLYTQSQANTRALQDQLDFQLSAVKRYEEAIAELEADNRYGEHDDTIKEFKEQLKEAQQAYESTQESWLSSWESTVQAAADIYEAELNQILEDFNKSVAGLMGSLDKLSERYSRIQATQSIYVEDYEKIYQLSKLTRDINNSLDDSTTLASKGKLRDIQKEINALQESGLEVSQYDLDVLRKKYEMAIAYEQWQDAQNAKTVVRMQRDNEGNYGYVYTADQSDVEAAQQNYEDKLHEMQVLNGDYINSLQEQIIQAEQECADALANLRASDYASYEEYQAAVEQIRSDYTERVEALSSQLAKALGNNQKLYEIDWTEYSKATGYKISADKDYIDRFEETVLSQLTGFKTIEEAQDAFVIATNDASDQAAERWEDWYIRSNDALELGGMSMQNYTEEVDEAINGSGGIVEQTQDAEEAVDEMADEYSEKFDDIVDYAEEFARDFDDVIQDIIDSCNEAIEAIRNLLEMMAELDGSADDYDDWDNSNTQWINEGDETKGEYKWRLKNTKTGEYATGTTLKNISIDADMSGKHGYDNYSFDEQGYLKASNLNSEHLGNYGGENIRIEEYRRRQLQGYATGGYTGEWGDNSGRLAVLHEKELVLNSDDTANILSAVDMIRSISNAIDLNALAAGTVFAGRSAAVVSSFGNDTLEQNVHITAEFPSVSDHNEIEEALNSLVERAAQFAGRKKF